MAVVTGFCDRLRTCSSLPFEKCHVELPELTRVLNAPTYSTTPSISLPVGVSIDDAIADAEAVLDEDADAGDEVLHRVLPTDGQAGADEAGAGEHRDQVDLHDVQHDDEGEDPGDQREQVAGHLADRVDALAAALLGHLGRLAEHALHTHPPERAALEHAAIGHPAHHAAQHAPSDARDDPGDQQDGEGHRRAG